MDSAIRRIDSHGRIVIPYDIRRRTSLGIGEYIKIYVNNRNEVVIKKHQELFGILNVIENVAKSLQKSLNGTIIITSNNSIIFSDGEKKRDYVSGKVLSDECKRRMMLEKDINKNNHILDFEENEMNMLITIYGENQKVIGSIIYLSNDIFIQNVEQILYSYAIFISEMIIY